MLAGVITVVAILISLTVLHELGHLMVARMLGFRIPVLGIGIPATPYMTFLKTKDTQYRMHLVPIGVYAEIPELDGLPANTADEELPEKPYFRFSLIKKLAVVLSGAIANLLIGVIILIASFMVLGRPATKLSVPELSNSSPIAKQAGVQPGDELISIDQLTPKNVGEVIGYIKSHSQKQISFHLRRAGQSIECPMVPDSQGKVGMLISETVDSAQAARRVSIAEAGKESFSLVGSMISAVGDLLAGGKNQVPSSGMQTSQVIASPGAVWFFSDKLTDARKVALCAAMLSIDFGFLHLLPLPGLDGGHFISVLLNHYCKIPWTGNRVLRWLRLAGLTVMLSGCNPVCMLRGQLPGKKKQTN